MHDEDFLAVGLGEVLELRAHAVEVEAVERDADIVHVDFLDDRPSLTERIDGSCRMAMNSTEMRMPYSAAIAPISLRHLTADLWISWRVTFLRSTVGTVMTVLQPIFLPHSHI